MTRGLFLFFALCAPPFAAWMCGYSAYRGWYPRWMIVLAMAMIGAGTVIDLAAWVERHFEWAAP